MHQQCKTTCGCWKKIYEHTEVKRRLSIAYLCRRKEKKKSIGQKQVTNNNEYEHTKRHENQKKNFETTSNGKCDFSTINLVTKKVDIGNL